MGWQVSIEKTPNPATIKFALNAQIVDKSFEFKSAGETDDSPLAAKIFGFPWTQAVFIGPNFISITKADWVDWEVLAEPLAGLLKEHLENAEPVMLEEILAQDAADLDEDSSLPIVKEIKRVLDREIRPAVALDGGDIVYRKYDSGRLYISMKGACSGCPSSQVTLKDGIEVRMKELFPEIKEVIAL